MLQTRKFFKNIVTVQGIISCPENVKYAEKAGK